MRLRLLLLLAALGCTNSQEMPPFPGTDGAPADGVGQLPDGGAAQDGAGPGPDGLLDGPQDANGDAIGDGGGDAIGDGGGDAPSDALGVD